MTGTEPAIAAALASSAAGAGATTAAAGLTAAEIAAAATAAEIAAASNAAAIASATSTGGGLLGTVAPAATGMEVLGATGTGLNAAGGLGAGLSTGGAGTLGGMEALGGLGTGLTAGTGTGAGVGAGNLAAGSMGGGLMYGGMSAPQGIGAASSGMNTKDAFRLAQQGYKMANGEDKQQQPGRQMMMPGSPEEMAQRRRNGFGELAPYQNRQGFTPRRYGANLRRGLLEG